ncbi:Exodeoxyribonuclease I subunit D [Actinokineospora alba]|uniref:Nuclease SbcCD subunit D n=1 Tax=Actinokineospora alba TaxID=504798 RepID=A0A1H0RRM0_9PSEU|nr:exonuclease SbcCD subunit D [Actinokineospora alba]TDP66950.1 exodeoxyribonuclease I subunit D [Actinokineospora alba]SDJ33288.1 exonuclease SbcD [Actinokineospora alba]SDP32073.1 Exodeoxyribonuclease I subunit D [Actinokineospora alba]
MRVLHTSDWHVGRTFHGRDLLAEQETVLTGLADIVTNDRVDVVVVSGDLYDRAVPSAEAVGVCGRALRRIADAGARIVVTPGNHDSGPRLGAFGEFAAAGGLYLRTAVSDLDRPVVIDDHHGPVAFYGIPYLEPEVARQGLGLPELRTHADVLGEAMRRVRDDLGRRPGTRSVVLAHAFVTGGEVSDSERTIAVGGVPHVPGGVFTGVDYAALGHLHGPQTLANHLRYSGSPMAYSFSEARHHKSVWLVDLHSSGLADVERRTLPVPRELAVISGELTEVLVDPANDVHEDKFLSVELTDRVRPVDAMRRLQARFPHAVHLEWRPAGGHQRPQRYPELSQRRDDAEVACCFVTDTRGAEPTETERGLLREALAAVAGKEPE